MAQTKKSPVTKSRRAISLFAVTREGPAQGGKAGCNSLKQLHMFSLIQKMLKITFCILGFSMGRMRQ